MSLKQSLIILNKVQRGLILFITLSTFLLSVVPVAAASSFSTDNASAQFISNLTTSSSVPVKHSCEKHVSPCFSNENNCCNTAHFTQTCCSLAATLLCPITSNQLHLNSPRSQLALIQTISTAAAVTFAQTPFRPPITF